MVKKSFVLRVLLGIDQLGNVLYFNGSEDHTISGRVGYKSITTNKWYWKALHKLIDALFFFDADHCVKSIETDEYKEYSIFSYNIITWVLTIWGCI